MTTDDAEVEEKKPSVDEISEGSKEDSDSMKEDNVEEEKKVVVKNEIQLFYELWAQKFGQPCTTLKFTKNFGFFLCTVSVGLHVVSSEPTKKKKEAKLSCAKKAIPILDTLLDYSKTRPVTVSGANAVALNSGRTYDDISQIPDAQPHRYDPPVPIPGMRTAGAYAPRTSWSDDIAQFTPPVVHDERKRVWEGEVAEDEPLFKRPFVPPTTPSSVWSTPTSSPSVGREVVPRPLSPANLLFDLIHHHTYAMIVKLAYGEPQIVGTEKVTASLFLHDKARGRALIIALATGSKCIKSSNLSVEGETVNDSHAEILTRRGFLRWLYAQVKLFATNPSKCPLERGSDGKLKLRDRYRLHLFISTAPCGDGRVYQFGEQSKDDAKLRHVGHMRHKIEDGMGTVLGLEALGDVQTMESIVDGQRLRTMSCSDKILKWNVMGLQGSLLSHFVQPLYVSSVTLAEVFRPSCISRAVAGRSTGFVPSGPFRVNLPHCAHADPLLEPLPFPPAKNKNKSINWNASDGVVEMTDSTTGRCLDGSRSRLCKRALFEHFHALATTVAATPPPINITYSQAKMSSVEYGRAQREWKKWMSEKGLGDWHGKPRDMSHFTLNDILTHEEKIDTAVKEEKMNDTD